MLVPCDIKRSAKLLALYNNILDVSNKLLSVFDVEYYQVHTDFTIQRMLGLTAESIGLV